VLRGMARLGQRVFDKGVGLGGLGMPRSPWVISVQPSGANMACSSASLPWLLDASTIFIIK
jgi:hypothetical protein